jgi:tetratricopeptide (TPR) repeat protein
MIDDLHRADPASIQLLAFAIRELRDAQVLIVGTYRDAELPSESATGHVFASLIREPRVRVLVLQAFTVQDVATFLTAVQPGHPIQADLPAALHDRSGGNPFFLTQLVHLLTNSEESKGRSMAIPSNLALTRGVRQAIAGQIEGLPESTRQVLVAASVMGREFSLNELSAALELPIDTVLSALGAARERRLLTEVPRRPRHLRFVHVLLRDALYDGIGPNERCTLHRRIAEAIERLAGADIETRAAELAHHYLKATPATGSPAAIRYSILAARRASAQLAFEDACRHYRAAIELLAPARDTELDRCELLLDLGEALLRAGERDQARATFTLVADRTRAIREPTLLARAALGLSPGLFAIEAGVVDPLLISLLEQALNELGEADSPLRAQVLARLAIALVWSDAEERRDVLSRDSLHVARNVGDASTLALALIARHGVLWVPSKLQERTQVLEELGRVAARASDSGLAYLHRILEIFLQVELGAIERFDPLIEAFSRIAEAQQDPHALWYSELFRGVRAAMQGRRGDADRHARTSLEYGLRVRDSNAMNAFAVHLTVSHLQDGLAAEILDRVRKQVEAFPSMYAWRAGLAFMCLESGDVAEARLQFEILAARDFAPLPWNETGAVTFALLAQVCAGLEDRRRAATLYEILLPAASHFVVIGFFAEFYGSIAHFLGLLAATLCRHDQASDHFEFALRQNDRVGALPWVAQTQYEFARYLLRRAAPEDRARAESLVAEAVATATRLELAGLNSKLAALQAEHQMEPAVAS